MHYEIAIEIIEYLHKKFPNASVAIAGSVANGTHKATSDIDLLFIDEQINNSYSISFKYKEVSISIFSFQKGIFYKHNYAFLYKYHNMPINYIYNANIIYDPQKVILDLKSRIEELFEKRKALKNLLISELKANIERLFKLDSKSSYEKKKKVYLIVNDIISIFFLRKQNRGINNKKDARDPFSVIKQHDTTLYSMLNECLPYKCRTYQIIKETYYNYFSINY
jgi:predicted nucleotidyltransferase